MKHIFILMTLSLIASSCAPSKVLLLSTPMPNTPTPIIFPTSTLEETSSVFVISKEILNTIPPDDIIVETTFFPGGAGGVTNCLAPPTKTMEKMKLITFDLCPSKSGIEYHVEIIKPNGDKESSIFISDFHKDYGSTFTYFVPWDGEEGKYTFIISSLEIESATFTVDVVHPDGPRLYLSQDRTKVFFYQFLPFEKIRMFIYTAYIDSALSELPSDEFIGWTHLQVDEKGSAILLNSLESDAEHFQYAAVGEKTGQILFLREGWDTRINPSWGSSDIYCEGAPNPQPSIGNSKVIITSDNVIGYEYLHKPSVPVAVPKGTELNISNYYGVSCKDNMYWYFTYDFDGLWVPEGKDGEYFFQPEN